MSTGDRHHISEYYLGGLHTLENLIYLCPSCHRDIPKFLTKYQQKVLQTWHIGSNKVANFQYDPTSNVYIVGTILFENSESIIKAGDQNVIAVTYRDGRLVLNAVMLEGFREKILILSNKVITADRGVTIEVKDDLIQVTKGNSTVIEINTNVKATNNDTGETKDIPWITGRINYKGKEIQFDKNNVIIPGAISSAKGMVVKSLNFILDIESGVMGLKQ